MKKIFSIVIALVMLAGIVTVPVYASTIVSSASLENIDADGRYKSMAYSSGYVYAMHSTAGLRVIDMSGNTPADVTPENSNYKGTYGNDDPVHLVCVYEDKLIVGMKSESNKDVVRIFDIGNNPASPEFLAEITLDGGIVKTIAAGDGFAFVGGYAHLTVIDLSTFKYKIFNDWNHKDYKMVEYNNGMLYGLLQQWGDGRSFTRIDIYDMNGIGGGFPNNNVGAQKTGSVNLPAYEASDILYCNNYVFVSGWTTDWMKRNIYCLDVSSPSTVSEDDLIIYPDGSTLTRVNDMIFENGLIYATDIDTNIYVFDPSDPANLREVFRQSLSGNHYTCCWADGKLVVSNETSLEFYSVYMTEVTIDNVHDGDIITSRPIEVSGTALGSSEVEVSIGNVSMKVPVDASGKYTAEFDDEFITEGENEVKAVVKAGKVSGEASVGVTINISPKKYEIVSGSIEITDTAANAGVTIRNNVSEVDNACFIIAAYKDNKLFDYKYTTGKLKSGENIFEDSLELDTKDISIRTFVTADIDDMTRLLYTAQKGAADDFSVAAEAAADENITAVCDVDNENKKVTVKASSGQVNGTDVLFMVYKPGEKTLDKLEYITAVRGGENGAGISFVLNSPAQENSDYNVDVFAKGKAVYLSAGSSFRYYGENYIRPILESIKTAASDQSGSGTIGEILTVNSSILAIDMGVGSDYAKLGSDYKNNVLESIRGKDFVAAGSLGLKKAFNEAVAAQAAKEKEDSERRNALEVVNEALKKTPEDVKVALIENGGIFGFDKNVLNALNKLDKGLDDFVKDLDADYTDANKLITDVSLWSGLEYVNQTPYTEMKGTLSEVKDMLGLDFGTYYPYRSDSDNALVHRRVADGGYKSVAALQKSFNDAVAYVNDSKKTTSGGGGGSKKPYSSQAKSAQASSLVVSAPSSEVVDFIGYRFDDLGSAAWAEKAIKYLSEKEIVNGKENNKFAPLDNVTRQEFVKLVVEAFNIEKTDEKSVFTDVNEDDWSMQYIMAAHKAGIVNGVKEGFFDKNAAISRQDMSVMLYRAMNCVTTVEAAEKISEFADDTAIAGYARDAVYSLRNAGVVNGMEDNSFAPSANATRAMAAQMIYNALMYME